MCIYIYIVCVGFNLFLISIYVCIYVYTSIYMVYYTDAYIYIYINT